MKNVTKATLGLFLVLTSACFDNSDDSSSDSAPVSSSPSFSADEPAAIVDLVADAVQMTGSGLGSGQSGLHAQMTSSVCDEHGYPLNLNESDPEYPGYLTYCFMTVNSGDTVYGGFELAKAIACALEEGGVEFNGVPQNIDISEDSSCFSPGQGPGQDITVVATGSSPASFNSAYAKGVEISIPDLDMTFKIAANVSNGKVSFITMEENEDGSVGATAGSLDLTNGDLRYEARNERFNCITDSRCGWNRHSRIYAKLVMSNYAPVGVESISFAYSNIQTPPGQQGYAGVVVSASGDLATGIKARLFQASNGSGQAPAALSDYDVVGNWVEVSNNKCFTADSESASTCDSGLALFTDNTKFLMHENGYTTHDDWFAQLTELSFNAVDLNEDVQ